ncbi:MAG TPA: FliM/FliN family flagellar motor C-terminal domain-containing protein [Candidatus Solibacter sp.]|nr:FliM/FliN family flagellar motor C-terminal domain-containing protein [Candidatus Solibacter sp.]
MSALTPISKEIAVPIPEELWEEANWLPCLFSVDLPVHLFTVRALLTLEPGVILETRYASSADVPVVVNSQRIGWAEFEVVEQHIGIRITELG